MRREIWQLSAICGKEQDMKIIDLHCDTMMQHGKNPGHSLQDNTGHISEEKLKRGEALAQCFALFVPQEAGHTLEEKSRDCYRRYNELYAYYKKDLKENSSWLSSAVSAADIRSNEKAGKISAVLTLEDGTFLGESIARLDEAYERGARMLGLLWNTENSIGYPNDAEREKHMRGLKPFGFELVDRMNELGMLVDVSHLNEGGFWDIAEHVKKPFLASHSCARSLCDHPRNLTDEQLRAVGNAGGVIGMNFFPPFVREHAECTMTEDVVRHIRHIVNAAGIDAAALGSDFDGMMPDSRLEFGDYSGYQQIVQVLLREFHESEVEKICFRNCLRLFEECLG